MISLALKMRRNPWLFSEGGWEGSQWVPIVSESPIQVKHKQGGFPSPHPGLGAQQDPAKRGVIRDSSWGAVWDKDTSARSVGVGMTKCALCGLEPSLFQPLV